MSESGIHGSGDLSLSSPAIEERALKRRVDASGVGY